MPLPQRTIPYPCPNGPSRTPAPTDHPMPLPQRTIPYPINHDSSAPTGRNARAQGIALGIVNQTISSPEGAPYHGH